MEKKKQIIVKVDLSSMISEKWYSRSFNSLASYEVIDVINNRNEVYRGLIVNALTKLSNIDLSRVYLNGELCNKGVDLSQANEDMITYGDNRNYLDSMLIISSTVNALIEELNRDYRLIEINYFYMSDILGVEVRAR